jgi:hypothetical protein
MLLVFIGRRPTSVMRKERRDCCEEQQHGFGWSNLMEIASVLETIRLQAGYRSQHYTTLDSLGRFGISHLHNVIHMIA